MAGKKAYFSKIMVMVLISLVLAASGCVQSPASNVTGNITAISGAVYGTTEKLEVFHFHMSRQCQGCINVGKCAEDAVNEYFTDDLKSGLVVFGHINAELPENAELVRKYEVTGASLWFGLYGKDGSFSKEQNIEVWYKTDNMEKCKMYIKGVIEEKLKSDVSWT